jgi:hypothetical protein
MIKRADSEDQVSYKPTINIGVEVSNGSNEIPER